MIVTRDAFTVLRLARERVNLTTDYALATTRGDEARAALMRRQSIIADCRKAGWIAMDGELTPAGEAAFLRAEATFTYAGGSR